MGQTDEEIVLLVQSGDSESFGILVERYEAKMIRYGKRFLLNRHDAEDLVQEVFIKAYTNILSFNAKKKFSPWLYRIAHNEFINAIKKRSREPLSFFDLDTLFPHPVARQTTDRELNKQETREILDHVLGKLDPKYREPLVLYYFEEMDYKDIAEVLRVPVSTVGVRLKRGKEIMKRYFTQQDSHYER